MNVSIFYPSAYLPRAKSRLLVMEEGKYTCLNLPVEIHNILVPR